jgi:molybdopterin converting factor small subunit
MPPPYESIIHGVADKLGARLQELEDQLTRQFSLYEKRDGERDQRTEQMIATFESEITALGGKLMQQPSAIAPDDAALSAVAESLSAKIEELRRQTAEKFNALASRAAEAQALAVRSDPSLERLAHLSAALEPSDKISIFSGQPGAAPADLSTRPVAAAKAAGDSAAEVHGQSEKEQLIKLEERMSSEIERVRAELKARSGRWKVRQSATLKRSGRFSLDPEL